MGMFDEVRSSYPLPEPFMGLNHTKDMDDFGGSMSFYHIDPQGYLWVGSYSGTSTLEIIEEDDPRYDSDRHYLNYELIPTGEHGKWRVHTLTKYIEIYPSQWDGNWETWPRLRLHFRSGELRDSEDVTGR